MISRGIAIIIISTFTLMIGVGVYLVSSQWLDWYYQEDLLVKFGEYTWSEGTEEQYHEEKINQIFGAEMAVVGGVLLLVGLVVFNKEWNGRRLNDTSM